MRYSAALMAAGSVSESESMTLEPALSAAARRVLREAACAIVPEAARLDEKGWAEFERLIESALRDRPESLRRRLRLFLRAIEWLPVLRYGRRFSALEPLRQASFLSWLETNPVLLIRNGFWGLRTLIFLGYYGQPEITRAIGYAADARGWEARR